MPKNVLPRYQSISATAMSANITSPATNIQYLDNVCIQSNWTGNATGTIVAQVSADHQQDQFGNITNAGNWVALSGVSASVAGSASQALFDLNQLSAPYIRTVFTTTFKESGSITAVADVSGSLNNKYFLINGANGTNWYIWFNINSAGVDPAIAGRTGVAVAAATNASANTLGGLIRTALASVTSVDTIAGANAIATFSQTTAGHGALTDGAAPTGFTLAYTVTTGVLDTFISAKAV
jgi:hypothetical protein